MFINSDHIVHFCSLFSSLNLFLIWRAQYRHSIMKQNVPKFTKEMDALNWTKAFLPETDWIVPSKRTKLHKPNTVTLNGLNCSQTWEEIRLCVCKQFIPEKKWINRVIKKDHIIQFDGIASAHFFIQKMFITGSHRKGTYYTFFRWKIIGGVMIIFHTEVIKVYPVTNV